MSVEVLLKEVISELKEIKAVMRSEKVDTCDYKEALLLLGLNNRGYLKYFVECGLLSRRKGGKSFLYYKSECQELAEKIRERIVIVPTVREIFNY